LKEFKKGIYKLRKKKKSNEIESNLESIQYKKGIYRLWKEKKSNEESNFDASRNSRIVSQAVKKRRKYKSIFSNIENK
jgi:hypothetical protein